MDKSKLLETRKLLNDVKSYLSGISKKYAEVLLDCPNMMEYDYGAWCPDKNGNGYNKIWYKNNLNDYWVIKGVNKFYILVDTSQNEFPDCVEFEISDEDIFDFENWKAKMYKRDSECNKLIKEMNESKKEIEISKLKERIDLLESTSERAAEKNVKHGDM